MPTVISTPITDELASRARAFGARVRDAERPSAHRKESIELINELTKAGLEGFFLEPSRELGLGSMVLGAVRLGLSSAGRAISVVVGRVLGSLDDDQMRRMADVLDTILLDRARD